MTMGRIALLASAAFQLGCTHFSSSVQTFHRLGVGEPPPSYSFVVREGQDTLEHRDYQELMRQGLARHGWREAPPAEAKVRVEFWYGGDNGRQRIVSAPVHGVTGISSSTTTATAVKTGNHVNVTGTTSHTPTYGVTGHSVSDVIEYTRRLDLRVLKAGTEGGDELLVEIAAISTDNQTTLAETMPYLVRALFDAMPFPARSGSVRRVVYPIVGNKTARANIQSAAIYKTPSYL
jgi:hypothetical protein